MPEPIRIDADFPGGNILVESIAGDVVRLRQDWRDGTEWWFYWHFRVRGAAGRTVRFDFTDGDVFTAGGPCFSTDGRTWRWLGRGCCEGTAFTHVFKPGCDEAYFALNIPYTRRNLDEYLATRPDIRRGVLATTAAGRDVDLLHLPSQRGTYVLPVTARLHACESMGSYAAEGLMDFWRSDEPPARYLREHVDLVVAPLFDLDGVEEGRQGKCRSPHDHNRDFTATPLYPATRAWQQRLLEWRGRLPLVLDLHCPWIREGHNEQTFLVGKPQPWQAHADRFAALLERSRTGELVYRAETTFPYGREWNQGRSHTVTRYARESAGAECSISLEIPYALAGGQAISAANVRAFGCDLGRAAALYLQSRQP